MWLLWIDQRSRTEEGKGKTVKDSLTTNSYQAYELIKKYGTIEAVLENLDTAVCIILLLTIVILY